MDNLLIEAVKIINPLQVILIGLIVFYFYNRLDNKTEKRMEKLEEKIDKIEERFESRIDKVETKLDTLIMALFRQNLNIPNPPEHKDAA